jgi:hypothetical protein
MSPEDSRRFLWLIAEAFFIYDGQYQFYRKGHLSEDSWQPKIDSLMGLSGVNHQIGKRS